MYYIIVTFFLLGNFIFGIQVRAQNESQRAAYLDALFSILSPEMYLGNDLYTPLDSSWIEWITRTGELPPNFDGLASHPYLPQLFNFEESQHTFSEENWQNHRHKLIQQVHHWITGNPPEGAVEFSVNEIENDLKGGVKISAYELIINLGLRNKRYSNKVRVKLFLPQGLSKHPIIMIPSEEFVVPFSLQNWINRGFAICLFEPKWENLNKSTSEIYSIKNLYTVENDFSEAMLNSWLLQKLIDHVEKLSVIDSNKIGIIGYGKNTLSVYWTAAFDERVKATLIRNGGAGVSIPFRFTGQKYGTHSIELLTDTYPAPYHPRLRFFVGRENKLPVDVHYFSSLIAPRGLMISEFIYGKNSNPWAIEQHYKSTIPIFQLLNGEGKFRLYYQDAEYELSSKDQQTYIDYFDEIFNGKKLAYSSKLIFDYSFQEFKKLDEEWIFPNTFPERSTSIIPNWDEIDTVRWVHIRDEIQTDIRWLLDLDTQQGEYVSFQNINLKQAIISANLPDSISELSMAGGTLFLSLIDSSRHENGWPVLIYLHNFNYGKGYSEEIKPIISIAIKEGYAVFALDLPGFGSNLVESHQYYQRFPSRSLLGNMVNEVKYSISALSEMPFLDKDHIYVLGNTLGGKVAIMSAALDQRIAGIISINGYSPWRDTNEKADIEGLEAYYLYHGLVPKLGYFKGSEYKIPVDYHEMIACIAPKPVLIFSSIWNKDVHLDLLAKYLNDSNKVYNLYQASDQLELYKTHDIQRTNNEMYQKISFWLKQQISF